MSTTHPAAAHPTEHAPATKNAAPTAAATKAATAKDAAADQQQLLLLLAADWLNGDRTHSKEIAALTAALTAASAPPSVVDVPYVSQAGSTLSCTMGNWQGEPTSYAYAWCSDGVANGATGATYGVQAGDSGHDLACVVTATNAVGSTVAPMSNAVTIA